MEFVAMPLFADFHLYMRCDLTSTMIKNLEYNTKWWIAALEAEMSEGGRLCSQTLLFSCSGWAFFGVQKAVQNGDIFVSYDEEGIIYKAYCCGIGAHECSSKGHFTMKWADLLKKITG